MDHDILAQDWNAHTLLVLSRQQIKEALEWLRPDHPFSPSRHLSRDYACGEADLGYVLGIVETRLDRELGIWVNLRRALDIAACLDDDAHGLARRLHGVLCRHFQLS